MESTCTVRHGINVHSFPPPPHTHTRTCKHLCPQVTGSFKARGATHKLLSLTPEQLDSGIITASTGNHALAVLHACKLARHSGAAGSLAPILFMPRTADAGKVEKLRSLGAEVVLEGIDSVEAEVAARAAATAAGAVYLSPYNDAAVAGGQGTVVS
jgi:threonine dehydratase